ncbi:hypothetical protein HD596_011439 [Nonomuraea jabiensis]|uniref:Uncharacterized protein n=1 Tax=Nonomuraea jabiensis TaxID=882448 RepID=A0A7W9GJ05_9ACTN|nr:hypothetical protein [Nonomuraea jabiensis]
MAAALAMMTATSSTPCETPPGSSARLPEVSASPTRNAIRPSNWCRIAPAEPLTPKVKRRFAAVLATAVTSSATALAASGETICRSSENSARYASVLTTPTIANLGSCLAIPFGSSARSTRAGTGMRAAPDSVLRATLARPRRSSSAVWMMSTRLSGSSTQSTGTSWMRSPCRSASSSSSVSKNHCSSSTPGSSACAISVRTALNPHCASENPAPITERSSRLYEREMNSRFGPRSTRDALARRVPMARSLWPDSSGATSGRNASRSVDRSTSM